MTESFAISNGITIWIVSHFKSTMIKFSLCNVQGKLYSNNLPIILNNENVVFFRPLSCFNVKGCTDLYKNISFKEMSSWDLV